MSTFNITSRYAIALLELSKEKNNFETVSSDVELISSTLENSKDTIIFLRFIIEKRRENFLHDILKRFIQIKNEKLGLVNVHVKSAFVLDEEQKNKLKNELANYTKKNVRINFVTDEDLIGGFTAKIGDTVLDGSVKQQLVKLRKQLLA